ncbi:purine-nucleoside phosphorylase [Longirhabdus pacifica]|uniref:purine-nucleoside phosphorylase n=1 Tax=Longirhabdus pacifica TaxID=2305227 RepID=UPI0010090699|nr:purine-nucleoside phosphorylase [Longirhabdus pacifica]
MNSKHIQEAAEAIKGKISSQPKIGLILGSGLGVLAELIENPKVIAYDEIPHFPTSTVVGHAGEMVIGQLSGKEVIMMKGRFHMYEGYDPQIVTFPVRVMKQLGVESLIVTNAAGGIDESFSAGDLMLITDHLNLTFRNPLIGKNDDALGARFPDMSQAYNRDLQQAALQTAKEEGIELQQGVYVGLLGPSYETPAEIRMLRTFGGSAVGMSTVTEVIVANHAGMKVLGISCISNMAAGILDQPLSHEEVMETTEQVKEKFKTLVLKVLPKM